jgi:hypothetical protein
VRCWRPWLHILQDLLQNSLNFGRANFIFAVVAFPRAKKYVYQVRHFCKVKSYTPCSCECLTFCVISQALFTYSSAQYFVLPHRTLVSLLDTLCLFIPQEYTTVLVLRVNPQCSFYVNFHIRSLSQYPIPNNMKLRNVVKSVGMFRAKQTSKPAVEEPRPVEEAWHFSQYLEEGVDFPNLCATGERQLDGLWVCHCGHENQLVHLTGAHPFHYLTCGRCEHILYQLCQTSEILTSIISVPTEASTPRFR